MASRGRLLEQLGVAEAEAQSRVGSEIERELAELHRTASEYDAFHDSVRPLGRLWVTDSTNASMVPLGPAHTLHVQTRTELEDAVAFVQRGHVSWISIAASDRNAIVMQTRVKERETGTGTGGVVVFIVIDHGAMVETDMYPLDALLRDPTSSVVLIAWHANKLQARLRRWGIAWDSSRVCDITERFKHWFVTTRTRPMFRFKTLSLEASLNVTKALPIARTDALSEFRQRVLRKGPGSANQLAQFRHTSVAFLSILFNRTCTDA